MKAFLCIMPCVLRNLRQNPFNRILCSQTRAFEMRNTYAMSRVQVHQVPKANWMARAIGHVASATKLPEPFSAESLQSHLRALRTLVQAEAKNGRWPVDFTNIESNSVENLLIQPLSKAWNLEAKIIWDLVSFVCTASDPLLCKLFSTQITPRFFLLFIFATTAFDLVLIFLMRLENSRKCGIKFVFSIIYQLVGNFSA